MADKITWADKESLVTDPTIAEINKVTDSNMNEIKSVTNVNADELAEKIVYDEDDITENTGLIIEEVPEGSNIPYINSEIAIGSSNNDNRPVWFKQSKNLFSSTLELGTYSNEGVKSASTTNYRNATPIQVQPNTTYTISINGVSQKYAVYYYNNTNTFVNSEGLTTGTFTTPANCYYINFRCFNADFTSDYANLKLQIEEGSTATTYEEYIAPSIIADNTEFYSRPVLLWTNPAPTSDFAGQQVTLSDSIANYNYYEVIFKRSTTNDYMQSTGKIPVGHQGVLQQITALSQKREISISTNKATFTDGVYYGTYGTNTTTTQNSIIIPVQIIGYK